jgi:hypothetical protein
VFYTSQGTRSAAPQVEADIGVGTLTSDVVLNFADHRGRDGGCRDEDGYWSEQVSKMVQLTFWEKRYARTATTIVMKSLDCIVGFDICGENVICEVERPSSCWRTKHINAHHLYSPTRCRHVTKTNDMTKEGSTNGNAGTGSFKGCFAFLHKHQA